VARLREEAERVRAALDAAESTLARPSEARETVAEVPTGRLRARLTSMADQTGIAITAVDPRLHLPVGRPAPAKAPHQQQAQDDPPRRGSRGDRKARPGTPSPTALRAWGHPHRRRTAPPPHDRWGLPCSNEVESLGKIVRGIGPSRPNRVSPGVREPAPAFPDHGHDPCRPDAERTRGTRTPNTVRDVRLSLGSGNRTHSRSVLRNGPRAGLRSPPWPQGGCRCRWDARAHRHGAWMRRAPVATPGPRPAGHRQNRPAPQPSYRRLRR
jgi:hypothetical protein